MDEELAPARIALSRTFELQADLLAFEAKHDLPRAHEYHTRRLDADATSTF